MFVYSFYALRGNTACPTNVNTKMKPVSMRTKYFALFLLQFLLFFNKGICQTISDGEKQQILRDLQHEGFSYFPYEEEKGNIFKTLESVVTYKITEAIPIVESLIWNSDEMKIWHLLNTLYQMNDPQLPAIAKAVIDTAESVQKYKNRKHEKYFRHPNYLIKEGSNFLFKCGDFTYADKYIHAVNDGDEVDIFMMGELAKSTSQYRDYARQQLAKVMNEDTANGGVRQEFAAIHLVLLGKSGLPDLISYFSRDQNTHGTNTFIAGEIAPYKDPAFEEALKIKLLSDHDLYGHDYFVKCLMNYYFSFDNYKFVSTVIARRSDEKIRNSMDDALWDVDPQLSDIPLAQLIDSLVSSTVQMQELSWLGERSFTASLTSILTTAKKQLQNADSGGCNRSIRDFQSRTDHEWYDTLHATKDYITMEGWRYFYTITPYIVHRLPIDATEQKTVPADNTKRK